MEIPLDKYQTNSLYVLSNGYYIDLLVEGDNSTTILTKTPEGAVWNDGGTLDQATVANSQNLKSYINSVITSLSTELVEDNLILIEIIGKAPIVIPEATTAIIIRAKLVDPKGNPINDVECQPFLFTVPEVAPTLPDNGTTFNNVGEFEEAQTDFENTQFAIGGALIVAPESTEEDGLFVFEYEGGETIDFSTSYIQFSKEDYYPRSVGPKLVKKGEVTRKQPQVTTFTGATETVDQKLIQQEDESYKAEITLKDPKTGLTAKGSGISQDREIAKSKARSKALSALGKKVTEENNKPPVYTLNNGYVIKFVTQGPRTRAITFTPEGEIFWEGKFSITSEIDVLTQEAIVAIENLTNTPSGTLAITESDPIQPTPSPQEEDDEVRFDLYELGRITLTPVKLDIEEEQSEALIQIQEEENAVEKRQAIINMPWESKFISIFLEQKERLKRVLLPYVLNLLAEFGSPVVNAILSDTKDPLSGKRCLSGEKLKKVLERRNKLVRQINSLYKIIRTLTKILKVTNTLILGIRIGLKIAQGLSAVPGPITPPFVGLKDLWNGLVEQGFYDANEILKRAGVAVTNLTISTISIGITLGYILKLLGLLDNMIQSCAQEINPETGEFVLSFAEINEEINSFKDPTVEGDVEQPVIDPLTNQPFPYKGFTFEIKDDISQNFQYPKRYAVARNIQGIQVLRSESSFASNPSILIEQLKFVIDRDNLRAD